MSLDDLELLHMLPFEPHELDIRFRLPDYQNVGYLNLMDYQAKDYDFYSGAALGRNLSRSNRADMETLVNLTLVNAFCSFVKYLRVIGMNSEGLSLARKRISSVVNILKCCKSKIAKTASYELIKFFGKILDSRSGTFFLTTLEILCFLPKLKFAAMNSLIDLNDDVMFIRRLFDIATESKFTFWGLWEKNFSFNTLPHCFVTDAYYSGNVCFLQLLLDYGFRMTHQRAWTIQKRFYQNEDDQWRKICFFKNGLNSRTSVIDEVILFLRLFYCYSIFPANQRKCFHLIWSAREDPYVTTAELIETFEFKFRNHIEMSEDALEFLKFLSFNEAIFWNGEVQVKQPRSLKHLCRCTIRKTLNDNWKMPSGVQELPVAEKIKQYILLRNE